MNSVAFKTLSIKARVYNNIRRDFYKKRIENFSEKEKIEYFDKLFEMNQSAHWELNDYKSKRKAKKRLYEERVARGYKFKKKTPKAVYLESIK